MAFIRRRKSDYGGGSHQLIETYRNGGKVRQRVLANLGRHVTIAARLGELENRLKTTEADLVRLERKPDCMRERCCQCFNRMEQKGVSVEHLQAQLQARTLHNEDYYVCVCLHRRIERLRIACERYRAEVAKLSSLRDVKIAPLAPELLRELAEADRRLEHIAQKIARAWSAVGE